MTAKTVCCDATTSSIFNVFWDMTNRGHNLHKNYGIWTDIRQLTLQHTDGIPVHREFILLSNLVHPKRRFDVTITYQTLWAPQSNTYGRTHGLNGKAAADMWKNKTAMAENRLDINSCGYETRGSVPWISMRRQTHQELRGNHRPYMIKMEMFCITDATTWVDPLCPQHLLQGNAEAYHHLMSQLHHPRRCRTCFLIQLLKPIFGFSVISKHKMH
jgi:hypothetical protein